MEPQKSFEMKPWMWVLLALALIFLLFGWDPVGDKVDQIFGQGSRRWAINLTILGMIIYVFFFGKK